MPRTVHPLADADLAAIALASPEERTPALAARLGRPYFTVRHARLRIARAGGWWCALAWVPCTECGAVLVTAAASPHAHTVHPSCRAARAARYSRLARIRQPGQSTPYVREWRERNPERLAEMREGEKARARARYPDRPSEERAADLAKLHAADLRDYAVTLPRASASGERWTAEDDAWLSAHPELPAREAALELGRTIWALRTRRSWLARQAENAETPRPDP